VIIDGGNATEVAIPELRHRGKILDMSSVEMSPDEAAVLVLERQGFDLGDVVEPAELPSPRTTWARWRRSRGSRTPR
jgi:hypothetical protein